MAENGFVVRGRLIGAAEAVPYTKPTPYEWDGFRLRSNW